MINKINTNFQKVTGNIQKVTGNFQKVTGNIGKVTGNIGKVTDNIGKIVLAIFLTTSTVSAAKIKIDKDIKNPKKKIHSSKKINSNLKTVGGKTPEQILQDKENERTLKIVLSNCRNSESAIEKELLKLKIDYQKRYGTKASDSVTKCLKRKAMKEAKLEERNKNREDTQRRVDEINRLRNIEILENKGKAFYKNAISVLNVKFNMYHIDGKDGTLGHTQKCVKNILDEEIKATLNKNGTYNVHLNGKLTHTCEPADIRNGKKTHLTVNETFLKERFGESTRERIMKPAIIHRILRKGKYVINPNLDFTFTGQKDFIKHGFHGRISKRENLAYSWNCAINKKERKAGKQCSEIKKFVTEVTFIGYPIGK